MSNENKLDDFDIQLSPENPDRFFIENHTAILKKFYQDPQADENQLIPFRLLLTQTNALSALYIEELFKQLAKFRNLEGMIHTLSIAIQKGVHDFEHCLPSCYEKLFVLLFDFSQGSDESLAEALSIAHHLLHLESEKRHSQILQNDINKILSRIQPASFITEKCFSYFTRIRLACVSDKLAALTVLFSIDLKTPNSLKSKLFPAMVFSDLLYKTLFSDLARHALDIPRTTETRSERRQYYTHLVYLASTGFSFNAIHENRLFDILLAYFSRTPETLLGSTELEKGTLSSVESLRLIQRHFSILKQTFQESLRHVSRFPRDLDMYRNCLFETLQLLYLIQVQHTEKSIKTVTNIDKTFFGDDFVQSTLSELESLIPEKIKKRFDFEFAVFHLHYSFFKNQFGELYKRLVGPYSSLRNNVFFAKEFVSVIDNLKDASSFALETQKKGYEEMKKCLPKSLFTQKKHYDELTPSLLQVFIIYHLFLPVFKTVSEIPESDTPLSFVLSSVMTKLLESNNSRYFEYCMSQDTLSSENILFLHKDLAYCVFSFYKAMTKPSEYGDTFTEHILKLNLDERTCFTDYISQFILPLFCANRLKKRAERVLTHLKGDISKDSLKNEFESESQSIIQQEPVSQRSSEKGNKVSIKNKKKNKKKNHIQDKNTPLKTLKENLNSALQKLNNTIKPSWAFDLEPTTVSKQHTFFEGTITLIDELSQKIKKETNLETCYGYYQEILKNLYSLSGSTREAEIVNLLEQPNTLATFLKDKPQFKSNLTWLKQKKESKMQEIQNKLSSSILEIFRVILKEAFDSRSSSNNSSEQSCNLIINAIKEKTSTPNSKLTSFFNALKELDETIDSDSLEQMIQTLCQLFEEVSKNTFTQDGIEKGLESIFLASAYTEADSKEASKTFRKIAYKSFEETLIQYQNCHNMITEQLLTIERSVDKEIDLIIKKANAVQAQIDKQHLDLAKRYWLNRFSESLSQSITHFISTGEKNETPIFWKHDSLSNDLNIFLKNETNLKAFLKDDDCTKVIDEALSKIKELDSDNLNKVFYELFFSKIKVYESNALTLLAERITNRFIQYSLKLTIVANSPLLDMLTLIVKDKDSCQIGPRFESAYFSAFCYAILKSKYKTYGHIFEAIQDSVDTTLQDHPSLSTEQLKSLSHIISYLSQFVLIEEGLDKAFTLFSERIYPRSNHIYSTSPDTLFFYHHTEIAIQETSMFKLNEFICEKIMYRENIFQAIDEAISFDPKLLKFSQFEQLDEEELRKRGQFLTTLITPNFPIEKTQPLFFYLLAQKWNSESQTLFGRYLLKEYLRILDIQKDTDMSVMEMEDIYSQIIQKHADTSVMRDIYLQILSYLFDLCYDIISKDMAVFLKRFLYKKESSWDNLSNLIDKSMTILHTSIRLLYDRIKTIQKNDTKKLDYYLWIQKSWMKKMRYITEFLFLSLLKPSIKNYTRSIVLQEKILKDIETLEATNNQHLSHSQHISAVASESIINNNLYTSMAPITDLYYFVLTRLITVLQNTPSIYAKKNYSKDRFLSPLTEAATAIKTYSFDKSPITKIVNTTENPHAVARTLNFIEHLFEISSDIADNPELSQGIQLIDFELDSAGASLKNLLSNFTSLSLYDFLNLPLNKISPDFGLLCDDSEQRFLTLLHNTFKKSVSTGNKKENETIQKILLKRYPKPASCQMDAILVYCLIHCIRNIHPTSDWTLSDFKKQLRDVTNEAYDKEDAFFGVDEKKIIDFLTDFALLVSSEGKSKINLELLGTCDNVQLQNTLRSINENDLPTIDCARLVTFIFDEYYSSLISQPQKSTGLGFKESLFFDNLNSILAYYFENLFIKTPITMAELCLILSKNQSLATTVSKWKTVSSISLQETLHSSYIRIHQLALDRDYRLVNTKKENYTSTELKIQDRIAFLSRFYFHSIGDLTHSNQTGLFLTLRASLEEVKWPENHTILLETFFSPSYFDLNQFWMTRPIENNHFPIASRTIVNILVRLIHLISNSNETDSELSESFFSHFIGQALIDTDTSKTLDLNAIKRIFKNNKNKKFDDIDKTLLTAFQSSLNRFLLRLVEDGSFPSSTCPELDNETIIALKYTIFNLCIHTFPTLSQLDLPTFFKQLTNRKTNSLALWVKNDSKLAHSVQFQIRMITYRLNLDFLKQYQASILNNQNLVEKKHLSDYLRAYAELFSFTLDTFFIELLLKKDALELDKPLLFDEKICFNHKEYLSLLMMIAKQFVGFCLDWSKETSFKYDSEYGLNIATFIESIQSNIAFLTQSLNGISESSAKEHVSKMIDTCKKEADKEQFKIHQLDTVAQEPRINLDLFESVKGKYMFPPLFYLAEQLCHLEKWLEWKKQGN